MRPLCFTQIKMPCMVRESERKKRKENNIHSLRSSKKYNSEPKMRITNCFWKFDKNCLVAPGRSLLVAACACLWLLNIPVLSRMGGNALGGPEKMHLKCTKICFLHGKNALCTCHGKIPSFFFWSFWAPLRYFYGLLGRLLPLIGLWANLMGLWPSKFLGKMRKKIREMRGNKHPPSK